MNFKKYIPMVKTAGVQTIAGGFVGETVGHGLIHKLGIRIPSNGKIGILVGVVSAVASGVLLEYSGQCLDAAFAPEVEEVIDAE